MNKETYQSETELKNKLKQIEEKLNDIQQLQEKYIEAFEQNLFPTSILQERLQQVSREKLQLEQNRNELNRHLSSSEAKFIDSNLIRTLLEKFVDVYKESSRGNKKQLLQLLIDRISIKQLKNRSRTVHNVVLDNDFSQVNISSTFTLIHLLDRETDNEHTFSIPASDNKIPPYLQQFLPLFMIRFTFHNLKGSINLFQ